MKKKNAQKKYYLVILIVLVFILICLAGLLYWKIGRIAQSLTQSAQKATSQNTPLSD